MAGRKNSKEAIVEKSEEAVKIFLGYGIIFMVVTHRTLHGQAEKGGADGGHAIDHILGVTFFG